MVEAVADENPLKYSLGRLPLPLASMSVTSARYSFIPHLFSYYHVPDSERRSMANKKNKTQFLSVKSSESSRVVRRATINSPCDVGEVSGWDMRKMPRILARKMTA